MNWKGLPGIYQRLTQRSPFSILAFFPEHQMKDFRRPNAKEMVEAYRNVKSTGLKRIRLGNLGVFVHNDEDRDYLMANIDMGAL